MDPLTWASPAQATVLHLLPLAKSLDEDKVTPGVLGFIVFAALGVAVWMLMKSMTRQMHKIDFEEKPPPSRSGDSGDEGTEASADEGSAEAGENGEPDKHDGDGKPDGHVKHDDENAQEKKSGARAATGPGSGTTSGS